MDPPQGVYARSLLSHRGCPLWTPEPSIELPNSYSREGLKIGDVGVVVPEEGSFDVFFNITLPPEHSLHAPDGVPDNFTVVDLKREDHRIVLDAECPGRVISSSGVECTTSCIDPFDLNGKIHCLTDHWFALHHNEGAMLILPQGAERHRLAKEMLFLDVIIQNAASWYRFARERLYRNISDDALYLITGFHKAHSWSLASFKDTGAPSARCKVVQWTNRGPMVMAHSTWETTHPLDWRIGPRDFTAIPNQSVFITGFKIAVREELWHLKRVTVKVGHSKQTLATRLVGLGASMASLFLGNATETTQHLDMSARYSTVDDSIAESDSSAHGNVTVQRVPTISQPFHPCDIINRYLLKKEPSAKIAVTHDNQWITLLEKGILKQDDLTQVEHLESAISQEYSIATKDGAVYLQNVVSSPRVDGGETTTVHADGDGGITAFPGDNTQTIDMAARTLYEGQFSLNEGEEALENPASQKDSLLVVFIHGFKGTDSTFGTFPSRLQGFLSRTEGGLSVECVVYPSYEIKKELNIAVARFVDWLTTLVVQKEFDNGGSAGTVKIVLCGHSTGGLLASDALWAQVQSMPDQSLPLWPRFIAFIAFDTPFLGIHRSVFETATRSSFGFFDPASILSFVSRRGSASSSSAPARDSESPGYTLGDLEYLEFVSELQDEEAMAKRLDNLLTVNKDHGIVFKMFYVLLPNERTFVVLPSRSSPAMLHYAPLSFFATDAVQAHFSVFETIHDYDCCEVRVAQAFCDALKANRAQNTSTEQNIRAGNKERQVL